MSSSGPTLHSARLINSLRTHLETDLKILARVHYKNHSQHHLALFWRRVVEVDRVGRRLLPTLETGLKEGATHAEARRLAQLTSRLFLAASHLHEHALPILNLTHFLPLITTLIAIASRVWSLCGVLYAHVTAVWARDFPGKRPLLQLEGWPDVPAAVSVGPPRASSSSNKLNSLGNQLKDEPRQGLPPASTAETGELILRTRTQTPASSAPGSSVLSPSVVDLGERIVRPTKSKTTSAASESASADPGSRVQALNNPVTAPSRSGSPFTGSSVAPFSTSSPPPRSSPPAVQVKAPKRPLTAVDDVEDVGIVSVPRAKKPSLGKKAVTTAVPVTTSPFDSLLVPKKLTQMASSAEGVVKKKKRVKRAAGDEIDDIFG